MKRVWTARSLAAVLGGSLLYFLITVLVMMCGSLFPLVLGLSPGHHRRRIGVAVSVSGGPNAPVWGTGTHELSGASAVPGGG